MFEIHANHKNKKAIYRSYNNHYNSDNTSIVQLMLRYHKLSEIKVVSIQMGKCQQKIDEAIKDLKY